MIKKYTHIDLFSGIGGFSLGLQQSGLNIEKTYFSEIDKYAISVYRRNFPDAEYLGSVDTISGRRFKGRKTIITFGFPCQDLSVAGKRKGFDGSRSSLFFEAMRIISEVRPDIFIFENVKGFYSSNDGKDFTIALQTIADLGLYECQWQLLNTAWFLPQNRERIYFVGSLGIGNRPKIFPITESRGSSDGKSGLHSARKIAMCLRSTDYKGTHNNISEVCPVLTPDRPIKRQNGRRIKDNGDPSFTLTSQDKHGVMLTANAVTPDAYLTRGARNRDENGKAVLTSMCERRIRRLTPIECERLQGFPDNWTKYGHEGQLISDTQRYKMCGNAVSIPPVKAIGEKLNIKENHETIRI